MKTLIGFALVLFATQAFATTVVTIPSGAKVEKYVYLYTENIQPASLSVCGMYSKNIKNSAILNGMKFLRWDGPFYDYLEVVKPIELTLTKVDTQYSEGTDCNYKRLPHEDVDWKCSDSIKGAWATTTLYFTDKYGNTWHTWDQTAMFKSKKEVGHWDDIGKATIANITKHLATSCAN